MTIETIRFFVLSICFISYTLVGQNNIPIPQVEELLSKMTIDDKIGQLNLLTPGGGIATGAVVSKNVEEKIISGQVGGLFGVSGPQKLRKAQDYAVKQTRLGIPLIFGSDIIHGYKTTFPIPLATAATWDVELIEKMAQVTAKEATADGINWNFSPMVDISRDPRWGRIAEGAGEDAYLGARIAEAMVRGLQGDDLSDEKTMLACVKHFALYGASEAGRDYNSVDMSRVKMFNQYMEPYKAAIDAGVGSVMSSFNDVEGIPASGSKYLLTEILRDQWGFEGFVVSDYTSVNEMIAHGLGDLQVVAAQSLKAGLDMDMVGEGFLKTLRKSLKEGKVTEEEITMACRRILEAKYNLGLFADPYRYFNSSRPSKDILTSENRELARDVARKSFVLLKNENMVLPLKKTQKIALLGPLADDQFNMLGTWAPTGDYKLSVSILDGFRNTMPSVNVNYSKGSNIVNDTTFAKKINVFGPKIIIDDRDPKVMLEEALRVANQSDVIVAVVGEASEMTGEASSRVDITIPEPQKKLIRALVATEKPVVLVLMSGRPLNLSEEMQMPISILQIWNPGVEAGNAVADVLYGKYNPAGKITMSYPRHVGQIPIYHSMKNTGRPSGSDWKKFVSNYLDVPNAPLLPFGYGLSYTNFEYSNLRVSKQSISQNETLVCSIDVENTGDYDGEEVVQLYLRDVVRSITPPKRSLKGFQKTFIKKGEKKTIKLTLQPDDLKFYNSELKYVAESGKFEVFIGGNSAATMMATFELIE